jgi:L-aspartate oxidase
VLCELRAHLVVLATGGVGQVYPITTNPITATGDGVGMALRAGVPLRDMAFVQFHPTALYTGEPGQAFLISEAVRGAGARLLRFDGTPLMEGVHPMGDLAPRHVVARALHQELVRSGRPHAWLDAGPIGMARFALEFPAIDRWCEEHGLVPGRDLLPVAPAAHYLCGGIATDGTGRTALAGLLALGECAGTGMHGADRLASNSLLEALVVPGHAVQALKELPLLTHELPADRELGVKLSRQDPESVEQLYTALHHAMITHVGLERTTEGLRFALRSIARCERHLRTIWLRRRWGMRVVDLRDLLATARAITEAALEEPAGCGSHCMKDTSPDEMTCSVR